MTKTTRKIGFCLILTLLLALPGSAQAQGGVTYVYDELGRLVGVVDAGGNAAAYKYDAVGNLLSITRYSSTQVSIIGFTPSSGPVGTTVTINGTGFSATPSQNTVRFNGVTATVTSASGTQIVTTVPTGATTGPISVTVGSVTATSDTPFTVRDASGAPTISGFTPTIGTPVPPTAVTITGTGFDTNIANDKTRFNVTLVAASSATPTTIAASVPPGGTSGHISVTTPAGKATSSGDFFVPPSPYGVADVGFTGRMAIGGTGTVTISTAGKIGLMLFDGIAGQRVSLAVTASLSGCCFNASILNPSSTTLSFIRNGGGTSFIEPQTLPATGTYTVFIQPDATVTGTFTLNPYSVVDITGPITADGTPANLNFTTPGQNARLTFSGTAGQRVSVYVSTSLTGCCFNVSILNPDSTTLVTARGGSLAFIDATTLPPTTGPYTVFVDPDAALTGTATVKLYTVVDITTTITPGVPVTVDIRTPGQNARLTFTGTVNQRVGLNLTNGNFPSCGFDASILKPDGTTLASALCLSTSGSIGAQTLLEPGTYTVLIDGRGPSIGSITVTLTSP